MFTSRKADPAFRPVATKIFNRDHYSCQFCSFQAREYQEVANLDNDYRNNKFSNLATACVFCTQCFFLESVGVGDFGGGTLIFLPELTQGELNSLCHVLFCAMSNGTSYKVSAQSLYRSLKFRSQLVDNYFGENSSKPSIMGRMMVEYEDRQGALNQEKFKDLRLLPSRSRFKKQIEQWAASAMSEMSDNS